MVVKPFLEKSKADKSTGSVGEGGTLQVYLA